MLNGKFYTGLPPKMIDKQCVGGRNRQESHFFWPDDTKADSAVDIRVKRRTSLQLDNTQRPRLEKRNSVLADNEVDTRQRFYKEFAKSSIQFYDNLQDEPKQANTQRFTSTYATIKKPQKQITPKLTATKLELPADSGIDEAYTMAKRKQAYASKIEFYDYMDENPNRRSASAVDHNDKRELERNNKNSPKLQVKRNVRNLSIERELREQAKNPVEKPLNYIRHEDEEHGEIAPNRCNFQPQYSPHPIRAQRIKPTTTTTPAQIVPKKILKHNTSRAEDAYDEFGDDLLGYVDNGVRNMRMRSTPPKKHVTYSDITYESAPREYYDTQHDERPTIPRHLRNYTVVEDDDNDANTMAIRRMLPNMRAGSGNQRQQRATTPTSTSERYQYMETGNHTLNNANNKTYNNKNNNNSTKAVYNNEQQQQFETRKITSNRIKTPTTAPVAAENEFKSTAKSASSPDTEPELDTESVDPRKHLRSSLCFNGEALIFAPTSITPTTRRNARSSATQRVSVGLPD